MSKNNVIEIKCLAIMPFSDGFSPILEIIHAAISKFNSDVDDVLIKLERADKSTKEPLLYQNVFRHINDCEIAIVDLTGQNRNVVFEFGYAVAKGKHIIPLTQDDPKNFDSDYKSYIYTHYQEEDLATLEFNLLVRFQEIFHSIRNANKADLLKKQIKIQNEDFEVTCFTNRKAANLQRHFEGAKEHIRIVQTNLATIVQDYADSIEKALTSNPTLEVKLLTLDPESYFAAVRASQLGADVSEFRTELHQSLYILYERFKDSENFEIRIYDDFPTQICFIIDNDIYNCVVSKYQPSRNNCVFKLDAIYPALHTSFNLHFTSVWRDAKTTKKYEPFKSRFNQFSENFQAEIRKIEAKYQAELKAKDREIDIYREKSENLKEISDLLANSSFLERSDRKNEQ